MRLTEKALKELGFIKNVEDPDEKDLPYSYYTLYLPPHRKAHSHFTDLAKSIESEHDSFLTEGECLITDPFTGSNKHGAYTVSLFLSPYLGICKTIGEVKKLYKVLTGNEITQKGPSRKKTDTTTKNQPVKEANVSSS